MTADLPQLRALISAQLRLDLRHPKSGAPQTSRLVLTVVSYAFSSLVLALSLAERGATPAEFLFAGLSFSAVLAAFGVAGSYDDLMGRPREHVISLTFPISEGTLYMARLANVGIFGVIMCASGAVPLALTAWFMGGSAWGLMLGTTLFAAMMGMTYLVLAAVWILTLAVPARTLKTMLSVTRAMLVGGLVLGYQWVATQSTLIIEAMWWPPYWVMAAWGGSFTAIAFILAAGLAIVLAFGVIFPNRYVAILLRSAEAESAQDSVRRRWAPAFMERGLSRDPLSRAGFGLAVAALRGDRVVRGRAWPAALLAMVFAGFAWWADGLGDIFVHGAENVLFDPAIQMHLSVLTILLFAAQAATQGLQVSDTPEAGWAFDILPIREHRALQIGAQQALLMRVLLPVHLVLFVLLATTMPLLHAGLHVAFWFAGCAVLTRLQVAFRKRAPLTRRSDRFSAGERFLPLLIAAPMALLLLILQSLTFTEPLSAALLVTGLLLLHSALGAPVRGSLGPSESMLRPAPALKGA